MNFHIEGLADFARLQKVKDTQLLDGNPEHALPRHIKNEGVDILILGLVARNKMEAIWVGSTTTALLDEPPCDMSLVTQVTNNSKNHSFKSTDIPGACCFVFFSIHCDFSIVFDVNKLTQKSNLNEN